MEASIRNSLKEDSSKAIEILDRVSRILSAVEGNPFERVVIAKIKVPTLEQLKEQSEIYLMGINSMAGYKIGCKRYSEDGKTEEVLNERKRKRDMTKSPRSGFEMDNILGEKPGSSRDKNRSISRSKVPVTSTEFMQQLYDNDEFVDVDNHEPIVYKSKKRNLAITPEKEITPKRRSLSRKRSASPVKMELPKEIEKTKKFENFKVVKSRNSSPRRDSRGHSKRRESKTPISMFKTKKRDVERRNQKSTRTHSICSVRSGMSKMSCRSTSRQEYMPDDPDTVVLYTEKLFEFIRRNRMFPARDVDIALSRWKQFKREGYPMTPKNMSAYFKVMQPKINFGDLKTFDLGCFFSDLCCMVKRKQSRDSRGILESIICISKWSGQMNGIPQRC